jgi:hypothetical protein
MYVLKGDWLDLPTVKKICQPVTLVDPLDGEGECLLRVIDESELPFRPEWESYSLRGYIQGCSVHHRASVDMSQAVTRWLIRFPENGALCFYDTKEEWLANLVGE